jgi:hypothetical protein
MMVKPRVDRNLGDSGNIKASRIGEQQGWGLKLVRFNIEANRNVSRHFARARRRRSRF